MLKYADTIVTEQAIIDLLSVRSLAAQLQHTLDQDSAQWAANARTLNCFDALIDHWQSQLAVINDHNEGR